MSDEYLNFAKCFKESQIDIPTPHPRLNFDVIAGLNRLRINFEPPPHIIAEYGVTVEIPNDWWDMTKKCFLRFLIPKDLTKVDIAEFILLTSAIFLPREVTEGAAKLSDVVLTGSREMLERSPNYSIIAEKDKDALITELTTALNHSTVYNEWSRNDDHKLNAFQIELKDDIRNTFGIYSCSILLLAGKEINTENYPYLRRRATEISGITKSSVANVLLMPLENALALSDVFKWNPELRQWATIVLFKLKESMALFKLGKLGPVLDAVEYVLRMLRYSFMVHLESIQIVLDSIYSKFLTYSYFYEEWISIAQFKKRLSSEQMKDLPYLRLLSPDFDSSDVSCRSLAKLSYFCVHVRSIDENHMCRYKISPPNDMAIMKVLLTAVIKLKKWTVAQTNKENVEAMERLGIKDAGDIKVTPEEVDTLIKTGRVEKWNPNRGSKGTNFPSCSGSYNKHQ